MGDPLPTSLSATVAAVAVAMVMPRTAQVKHRPIGAAAGKSLGFKLLRDSFVDMVHVIFH